MSAVRYFDDVPHIVRYGMCDEKDENCWMLFWRNGVEFTIDVGKKDVYGTAFYSIWQPLLRERLETGETVKDHLQKQWLPLCDLIISHSMATLQRLAPNKAYWVTLRDYLHTPSYALKLVTNTEHSEVYAEVMQGPEEKGAYGFQPVSIGAFRNMPNDIKHYASGDLVVLEKEKNWKVPPQKVCTSDGHVCYFKACKRSTTTVETGELTNKSLANIELCLELFKHSQRLRNAYVAKTSTVLGIVTDISLGSSTSLSAGQILPKRTKSTETGISDTLVAGILLSSIPHGQSLAKVTEQAESTAVATAIEQSRCWKSQIEENIAEFHSAGIYWGGEDDHFNINQHTILIDAEGRASLDVDMATLGNGLASENMRPRGIAMDTKAIETLFEEWLPNELSKRK